MRYRVTFMERTNAEGEPSEYPSDNLTSELPDGVVLDSTFVERTEPAAVHSEERLEEDDDFLSVGSETWDYEVSDDRQDEFLKAVRLAKLAIECLPLNGEEEENGGAD
jgi:Mg2+ and Co2+ transporter CorA